MTDDHSATPNAPTPGAVPTPSATPASSSAPGASPTPPASPKPPAQGPLVPAGSLVAVVVSGGPSPTPAAAPVIVPAVVGVSEKDALAQLQSAGLAVQVFSDVSATVPKGHVSGQLPDAGLSVPKGTSTVVLISTGPAPAVRPSVILPNVTGTPQAAALDKLRAAGLDPRVVSDYSPKVAAGTVMAQLPNAHSLAQAPKKKVSGWVWALVAAAVLLLLVGGVYLYNQNQNAPITTAETTATPSVESSTAAVPNVVGMPKSDAEAALTSAGFVPLVKFVSTNDTPEGNVTSQLPEAGSELTKGSQVAIEVAQPAAAPKPTTVKVPNVVGMTQAKAQNALSEAGLVGSFVNQANSASKGTAFDQEPNSGTAVAPNSVVIVGISSGTPPPPADTTVVVPNVVGMTQANAQAALANAKLTYQAVSAYSDTKPQGAVFVQWPPAGNKVAPATPVALVVSMGKAPASGNVTVPNVKGMDEAAAQQALTDAGLVAQSVPIADPQATPGNVVGQLPAANSTVPPGSTVLIGVAGAEGTQP